MAAMIARSDRTKLSNNSIREAMSDEKISAFESYFNYAGSYVVKGDVVIHEVSHAHNPNLVGTRQRRTIRMANGLLTLTGIEQLPQSGVTRTHSLVWQPLVGQICKSI